MNRNFEVTGPQWSDVTADEICSELSSLIEKAKQMKKAEPLGVIIAAGETAYPAIRKIFPEDTETIKIKSCPYLEKRPVFCNSEQELPDHERLEMMEMNVLRRLIIFLVRLKLHLRRGQKFQFDNQKTNAVYWFTEGTLMKMEKGRRYESSVSLNWLLNDDCKIKAPPTPYPEIKYRGW